MPFTGDDLTFLQKSLSDHLAYFAKAFGDTYILSGCAMSPGYIAEGYVVVNGEICYHKAENYSLQGHVIGDYSFEVIESAYPAGSEIFADGQNKDTYIKRIAQLTLNQASTPLSDDFPTISSRIAEIIGYLPVETELTFAMAAPYGGTVRMIVVGKKVTLQGKIITNNGGAFLFGINSAYWPSEELWFTVATDKTPFYGRIKIDTSGVVSFYGMTQADPESVYINCSYYLP